MGLITWIILGGVAGWIATLLTKKNKEYGIFGNITIGIVGAVLGGVIVGFLGGSGLTGFNLYSLAVAIFGSAVLLWIVSKISA